jgi:1-aminocyclopropane-1-carboxylate deaminase/D-cysteine desulfhydrase-like pyridoxal-dependent ACC family enzyme
VAGLLAGLALIESPLRLQAIDVGALWKDFTASIGRLAGEVSEFLGHPLRFEPARVPLVERTYVGKRYGRPTEAGLAAMRTLARREGVFLDPVYTAKAFAGMLDLCGTGAIPAGEPVIFVHTGGLPALFATLPPP